MITATTDQPTNSTTSTAVSPRSDCKHRRRGRISNASSALNRGIALVTVVLATSRHAGNVGDKVISRSFVIATTPGRMRARYAVCKRNTLKMSPQSNHMKPMLLTLMICMMCLHNIVYEHFQDYVTY